jgi:putative acetyltransferase
MDTTIRVESPLQDDIRLLVEELDRVLLAVSPPDTCYMLNVEQMSDPSTTVWVARQNGRAVACGALKRHPGSTGEVKRMYTRPDVQGQGIGRQILDRIIGQARSEGLRELVLETGRKEGHAAAWAIYERAGFQPCGPVLDYPQSAYSAFFRLTL